MSHEMLRPFIVKVSVLGYFPLVIYYHILVLSYFLKNKYQCFLTAFSVSNQLIV